MDKIFSINILMLTIEQQIVTELLLIKLLLKEYFCTFAWALALKMIFWLTAGDVGAVVLLALLPLNST